MGRGVDASVVEIYAVAELKWKSLAPQNRVLVLAIYTFDAVSSEEVGSECSESRLMTRSEPSVSGIVRGHRGERVFFIIC